MIVKCRVFNKEEPFYDILINLKNHNGIKANYTPNIV